MGIGVSVFLITVGAIFRFAITVELSGLDIKAMGNILMLVGAIWLVISLIVMRRRGSEQRAYDDYGNPPSV